MEQLRAISGLVVVMVIPVVIGWHLLNAFVAGQRIKLRGLSGFEWLLYLLVFLFAQANTERAVFWDVTPSWLELLVIRKGDPYGPVMAVIAVLLVLFLAAKSMLRTR